MKPEELISRRKLDEPMRLRRRADKRAPLFFPVRDGNERFTSQTDSINTFRGNFMETFVLTQRVGENSALCHMKYWNID